MDKILVVEDSPEISALIALTLRMEGYEVLQAYEGARALEIAAEFGPSLILLDVMMPGMSGFEVAERLKKSDNTRNSSIIFVTAKHELDDLIQGLEVAVDYICKPFAVPELVARVRAALRMQTLQRELTASNEELSRLAVTDGLTGLLNRRGFDQQLEDEIWRARRFNHALGLVIFDLDRFKTVNDTWGHQQGDVVLRHFANTLLNTSRRVDKVARFGGEEFALLLPATDATGVRVVAEKVRVLIENLQIPCPNCGDGGTLSVTVSGGGAILNDLSETGAPVSQVASGLFEVADQCLYEAKQSGRNQIVTRETTDAEITQIGMLRSM